MFIGNFKRREIWAFKKPETGIRYMHEHPVQIFDRPVYVNVIGEVWDQVHSVSKPLFDAFLSNLTMDLNKLRTHLEAYDQGHLLDHYDRVADEGKEAFLDELWGLDLPRVNRVFELSSTDSTDSGDKDTSLEPIPESARDSVASASEELLKKWREAGLEAIADNKVAVLLLAGGQGTRLNVPYPKGMYNVGLPSQKTLYQIQAERILKVQKLAEDQTGKSCVVPWYEKLQIFFPKCQCQTRPEAV